ncbi:MAG TPA: universal stress protein [Gaiellaceae bacterium]
MARKLPRFQRALDAKALASVAYGEIASSIYFALGIVALHALGFTPWVLLVMGALFLLVSMSYAEGTASIPETGGAATLTRIAFNDLVGFATGWVLFLDYLIVIALSALFLPHYLGQALSISWLDRKPGDVIVGVTVILLLASVRLVRRSQLYRFAILLPVLDLCIQLMLVALGFALVFSPHALTEGVHLGTSPSWHGILFALPLAMLAYTGLETVSNLAEEAREPGVNLPRSLFSALTGVVVVTVLIAIVGISAFPARNGVTGLGTDWLRAPLMGITASVGVHLPHWLWVTLRVAVGLSGALILFASVTTSMSGFTRLAYSLGEHGQIPRVFGRLNRRSLVSPQSIVSVAAISSAIVIATSIGNKPVAFLASLYSFGVLLAFTAAQLAVIRLRIRQPDRARPFRVPWTIGRVPVPSAIGAVGTSAVFVIAMATHPGARYAGPAWLLAGLVIYGVGRYARGEPLLGRVVSSDEQVLPETHYSSILVPMKLGLIGEEMIATAVKLAQERGVPVEALHVIRVPLDKPIDAELLDEEEAAAASLAEAKLLGAEHGVEVRGETVRARTIGEAIVKEAERRGADLIVLGSAPRWRRQSRFFSPTVEYVLKKAPCEVVVVAFPQGVVEGDGLTA